MNKILERLMELRGISEEDLTPKYDSLADPFLLPDMEECVKRICEAIDRDERILIYGDYDVDGVTAAAVMYETLKLAGAGKVEIMLPDRFVDGYGMSTKVVQKAKETGVELVITVDCGSSNAEIIKELSEYKIYTIVTDHHELLHGAPEAAVAVVNPKREDFDCESYFEMESSAEKGDLKDDDGKKMAKWEVFRDLAGVGVAFEVARALVAKGRIAAGQEKWLMDLVVIGTVADRMKMRGENWKLGYFGLKVLQRTRRKGLVKLMKIAGIAEVSSETIGFGIAPRLNAAGRMQSAEMAIKLLLAKDEMEAEYLATELNNLNSERKEEQRRAIEEIEAEEAPVLVVRGSCHEGVIGIVAGRLLEKYKKPTFVFTETTEPEQIKCSGRSFGDFSLAEALKNVNDLLVKGGGHAAACGATILAKDFDEFKRRVNEFYVSLGLVGQERFLEKGADLEVFDEKIDVALVEELGKMEPFGAGNEEPLFIKKCVQLKEVRKMGKDQNHLSFMMDGVKMVYFFAPEEVLMMQDGEIVDVKFTLVVDEWNGVKRVSGRVAEIVIL